MIKSSNYGKYLFNFINFNLLVVLKKQRQSVSTALLQKLKTTCPNLKALEIQCCDFNSIEVENLPESLLQIRLTRCEIPLRWFESSNFSRLESLELNSSSRVCHTHLKDLTFCCKTSLRSLSCKGCYRIDDRAIEVIVKGFQKLTKLNFEDTQVSFAGILELGKHFSTQLEYLNIKQCKHINKTDQVIDTIKDLFLDRQSFKLDY